MGGLTFSLPDNIEELQESLGGEGACVNVGYSLISTENDEGIIYFFFIIGIVIYLLTKKKKIGVPTASLSFFSLDCETGTWYVFFYLF